MSHLTLDNRITIQEGLNNGLSLRKIAKSIGKSASTVQREVLSRKVDIGPRAAYMLPPCKRKKGCDVHGLCKDIRCYKPCRNCGDCKTLCNLYKPDVCEVLEKSPYVCNGCPKKISCTYSQIMYYATDAHNKYLDVLVSSREGINQDPRTINELDHLISPLLRKGQSLSHIYANHSDEIPCSMSTLYNYIDASLFSARNIDLRRKVKYKVRNGEYSKRIVAEKKLSILTRNYTRFNEYMRTHPDLGVVEMDTVVGPVGSRKCVLTMLFRSCNLMLGFLLDQKSQECVINVFRFLSINLGTDTFKRLFPVFITDRGIEFQYPEALECNEDGEICSRVFYCDPQASWQKGAIERNHELLRYIIPKGQSFDSLNQDDITLAINHINSLSREKFNGKTPYMLSRLLLDNKLHEVMKLVEISPDDVTLTPGLLRKPHQ